MDLAQRLEPLEEFLSEPSLTVACVILVSVSIAWVIVSRLIARKLKKAERSAGTAQPGDYQAPKDIWVEPPP